MIRKFLGFLLMLASSLAFAVPAAYVHEMTGSGSAAAGGKSRALAIGGLLESGDVISVDQGGAMTVKFEDGQIVVLKENSRFAIEKYDYNKKNVAQSSVAMSLLSGGMRFITGVIGGTRKEAIAMKAGTATIGIRGTDLAINIAGTTYVVTVQAGNIVLTAQNATISVAQGQGSTGQTNQAPQASRPVSQLPPAVVTLVAAVSAKPVPGTNPIGVASQAALVRAVEAATRTADAAALPNATQAQKEAAVEAARQIQTAITNSLRDTQTAITTAIQAGAPSTTAVGDAPKAATQPGITSPIAAAHEINNAASAANRNLPPAEQITTQQLAQMAATIAPSFQTRIFIGNTTVAGAQKQELTAEQQAALEAQQTLINQILAPPPTQAPPTTCGGAGQSPC